jgi:hypothetical protein
MSEFLFSRDEFYPYNDNLSWRPEPDVRRPAASFQFTWNVGQNLGVSLQVSRGGLGLQLPACDGKLEVTGR